MSHTRGEVLIPLFKVFTAPDTAERVAVTLQSGYLGEGPRVQEFEHAFGQLVGSEQPILALNSCTSALELSLHLIGVGPGDEVISTPMTCTATNGAIVHRGARIVWADIDPLTGLIDVDDVARKTTSRTKAIVAVDWAGRSCDYDGLRYWTASVYRSKPRIPIIQDAAHNLLVDMDNRGDYVCWSFQAIKHLTTGDGGALLVPPAQSERARLLRWYGLDRTSSADFRCSQDITEVGWKFHMNDVAASIGLANLPHMAWVVKRHRENAAYYQKALQGAPGISLPRADARASWWLFSLLADDRDGLAAHMAEDGIATSQVHRRNDEHSAFRIYNRTPLPGVDAFSSRHLAIPVGWWLSESEREHIASSVLEWAHTRLEAVAA